MIDISQLPEWAKLEIRKEDLLAFADRLQAARQDVFPAPPEEAGTDLMTFIEMCSFLGIAQSTGYQRVSRGEIPHFKKGRRLYFRKAELVAWIESGRRETTDDLDAAAEAYLRKAKRYE